MIINYVTYLRDDKKDGPDYRSDIECAPVNHFFEMDDINLYKHKTKRFLFSDEFTHDDMTRTNIHEA